jgi:hypothetical protein
MYRGDGHSIQPKTHKRECCTPGRAPVHRDVHVLLYIPRKAHTNSTTLQTEDCYDMCLFRTSAAHRHSRAVQHPQGRRTRTQQHANQSTPAPGQTCSHVGCFQVNRSQVRVFVQVCIALYVCMYDLYVCINVCMYVCLYDVCCMYVCMYVCKYV